MPKRHLEATSAIARPGYLLVHLNVHVGTSLRFAAVKVPYEMLQPQYRALVEGMERVTVKMMEAEADVLYLPLEKWE